MNEIEINSNFSILDSTLREGQQSIHPTKLGEGIVFTRDQQLEITDLLQQFGVEYIEVGSPIGSEYQASTIKEIACNLRQTNTRLAVHCRCAKIDIDAALKVNPNIINLYIGTSPENRNGNGARSLEETITLAQKAAYYVKSKNEHMIVRFSTEDAFRTPPEDLKSVIQSVEGVVDKIGLPDTTGCAYPHQIYDVVSEVRSFVDDSIEIEFHGHNDRGLALANYLEALRAGANIFDATIMGGERNGIATISGLIASIYSPVTMKILREKYNLKMLPTIDQTVADMLGINIPLLQPLTSLGAFSEVSGVHASAHLKSHDSYMNMPASEFGREPSFIVASSVVGGAAIANRALEIGLIIDKEMAKAIAGIIRERAREYGGMSPQEVDQTILEYKHYQ